jgi:hypothetical protein
VRFTSRTSRRLFRLRSHCSRLNRRASRLLSRSATRSRKRSCLRSTRLSTRSCRSERLRASRCGPLPSRRPSRASWQLTNLAHFRSRLLWSRSCFLSRLSAKAAPGRASAINSASNPIDSRFCLFLRSLIQSSRLAGRLCKPALLLCRKQLSGN